MKFPRTRLTRLLNSRGKVYYGLHFYPGVAEYAPPGENPYRVFLNEATLRRMDPTFAGRPVYVMHVDGVPDDVDEVRSEADGWVIESFFNKADGKHWVKFLVCSERGETAITRGFRLSNCYAPTEFGADGVWNGVSYQKEVTGGEYEHLALVPDPRYDESVVLTPEQFKEYNAKHDKELARLANTKGDSTPMKIKLFRKTAVEKLENAADLASVMVTLKSGKELTIEQLVNAADDFEVTAKNAGDDMLVNMGEGKDAMSVNDLRNKYNEACEAIEAAKAKNAETATDEDEAVENADDEDEDVTVENEGDDETPPAPPAADKKKNEADAKAKADALRNAADRAPVREPAHVYHDAVAVGRQRYGSK